MNWIKEVLLEIFCFCITDIRWTHHGCQYILRPEHSVPRFTEQCHSGVTWWVHQGISVDFLAPLLNFSCGILYCYIMNAVLLKIMPPVRKSAVTCVKVFWHFENNSLHLSHNMPAVNHVWVTFTIVYSVSVVLRIFRQMSDLEKSVGFRRILSHFV